MTRQQRQAVAMALKSEEATVNSTQSLNLMKNLVRSGLSSIAFIRNLFPPSCFKQQKMNGMTIYTLEPHHPEPRLLIDWIDRGCLQALEKRYLEEIVFGIHGFIGESTRREHALLLETYNFVIRYHNGDVVLTRTSASGDTVSTNVPSKPDIAAATVSMIRSLVALGSTFRALPEKRFISMKLLYRDDITPADYQPEFFRSTEGTEMAFSSSPVQHRIGSVCTPHHELLLSASILEEDEPLGITNDSKTQSFNVSIDDGDSITLSKYVKPICTDSAGQGSSRASSSNASLDNCAMSLSSITEKSLVLEMDEVCTVGGQADSTIHKPSVALSARTASKQPMPINSPFIDSKSTLESVSQLLDVLQGYASNHRVRILLRFFPTLPDIIKQAATQYFAEASSRSRNVDEFTFLQFRLTVLLSQCARQVPLRAHFAGTLTQSQIRAFMMKMVHQKLAAFHGIGFKLTPLAKYDGVMPGLHHASKWVAAQQQDKDAQGSIVNSDSGDELLETCSTPNDEAEDAPSHSAVEDIWKRLPSEIQRQAHDGYVKISLGDYICSQQSQEASSSHSASGNADSETCCSHVRKRRASIITSPIVQGVPRKRANIRGRQ